MNIENFRTAVCRDVDPVGLMCVRPAGHDGHHADRLDEPSRNTWPLWYLDVEGDVWLSTDLDGGEITAPPSPATPAPDEVDQLLDIEKTYGPLTRLLTPTRTATAPGRDEVIADALTAARRAGASFTLAPNPRLRWDVAADRYVVIPEPSGDVIAAALAAVVRGDTGTARQLLERRVAELPPCDAPWPVGECARPQGHSGCCSYDPDYVDPPHVCPVLPHEVYAVMVTPPGGAPAVYDQGVWLSWDVAVAHARTVAGGDALEEPDVDGGPIFTAASGHTFTLEALDVLDNPRPDDADIHDVMSAGELYEAERAAEFALDAADEERWAAEADAEAYDHGLDHDDYDADEFGEDDEDDA